MGGLPSGIVALLTLWGGQIWAHAGHTTPAPWAACAHSALGDSCQWDNEASEVYRGTCRAVGDGLVCVRNRPIERASTLEPGRRAPATDWQRSTLWLFSLSAVLLVGIGIGLAVFRRRRRAR